jgi:hypothetical protein
MMNKTSDSIAIGYGLSILVRYVIQVAKANWPDS